MKLGVHKNIKIVSCFIGESPEKKTPFFGLEFENQEGERIEKDFYLKDGTESTEKNIQLLLDAGFKGKNLSDMADPKFSIADLFGEPKAEMSITVIEESYDDKDGNSQVRNVVQWFNVGFKGKTKADHAGAKMIFKNTSFDGLFSKMKKGEKNPPKAKESMQADTPEVNSDDVPF